MKAYLDIFIAFMKISLFTFGGGYAIIPMVERELIKNRGWATMDEVMEYYTISQITPGLIGTNLATFIGYRQKGVLGSIFGTLGYVLPSATLVVLAAIFISNLAEIPEVQHAFTGIRIAVGALVLDTVIKMVKNNLKDAKGLVIYIMVFICAVLPYGILPVFVKSPVTLVLVSGLAGLLIYREKKEKV